MLDRDAALNAAVATSARQIVKAWSGSNILTPRQASALVHALNWWADVELGEWLRGGGHRDEPLHETGPCAYFDTRVMILVNDNQAWAAKAQERCYKVAQEIEQGVLPFFREGCYFDEVLMAAALKPAQTMLIDMPDLFDALPVGEAPEVDDESELALADDDWDSVSDSFDDRCQWDDWEVPIYTDHPILPAIVAKRHPYTWFDLSNDRPLLAESAADLGRGPHARRGQGNE